MNNQNLEIPKRLKRLTNYYAVVFITNLFIFSFSLYNLIWQFLPNTNYVLKTILLISSTIVLTFWISRIILILIGFIIYRGDYKGLISETEFAKSLISNNINNTDNGDEIASFEVTIVNRPNKPIGKYQNADIFEWLMIEGHDKKIYKFVFDGTLDMSSMSPTSIPDDCLLLPPGILYKLHKDT